MMNDNFVGLIAIVMTFSVPLTVIWSSHQRKMAELRLKMQQGGQDNALRATVEALREEVRALRDTTMQYDLSFDTALQNIEHRVQGVERQKPDHAALSNERKHSAQSHAGRPRMNADWMVPMFAIFMIFGGGGYLKSILEERNKTRIELAKTGGAERRCRRRARNCGRAAGTCGAARRNPFAARHDDAVRYEFRYRLAASGTAHRAHGAAANTGAI